MSCVPPPATTTAQVQQGSSTPQIVRTASGVVSGVNLNGKINVFRGVPFAKPPIGKLRWRAPKPTSKWEGIRKCDSFSDVAWQSMSGRTNPPEMNEDCLYLNIWAENLGAQAKRPVMVWIHGGGLNRGWSSQAKYDGTAFAESGVVFVSVNYRLGPLGFLAHPGLSAESPNMCSGNYGILDQIEALKWIHENIAAFGGDPENVTIFGESAGGTSVAVLCASPVANGLFHRAILQSPWMFGYINKLAEPNIVPMRSPASNTPNQISPNSPYAEAMGKRWANRFTDLQGQQAIAALRAIPAAQLVNTGEYYKTRVTIDDWVLTDQPATIFAAGKQANVPVIIGTTKDEGNFFANFIPVQRDAFDAQLNNHYGDHGNRLAKMYRGETPSAIKTAGCRYITNAWFVQPSRQLLRGMSKVSSPAFQYQFAVANRKNPALGSPHAIELKYVFGTLADDASARDKSVSNRMIRYWSQFAKTGDPNAEGLPAWPAFGGTESFLRIAETCESDRALAKEACDALDAATHQ
ncbi:MAG: carboxylesterase family protein [Rubripirellula sp.]|nr:carboxylesterase family protein [Rubripirellula sp.]